MKSYRLARSWSWRSDKFVDALHVRSDIFMGQRAIEDSMTFEERKSLEAVETERFAQALSVKNSSPEQVDHERFPDGSGQVWILSSKTLFSFGGEVDRQMDVHHVSLLSRTPFLSPISRTPRMVTFAKSGHVVSLSHGILSSFRSALPRILHERVIEHLKRAVDGSVIIRKVLIFNILRHFCAIVSTLAVFPRENFLEFPRAVGPYFQEIAVQASGRYGFWSGHGA